MSTTNDFNVAAELARLRGDLVAGFTRVEGQLALIDQKHDRTARDVEELDSRVSALEARRVPLGLLAAVSGTVSALVAAGAFLVQL